MAIVLNKYPSSFMSHLFGFFQMLKCEGVKVTLPQEIDTCRSLQYIDIFNFEDFYHSLKTNLISHPKDIPIFDNIFFPHWQELKEISEEETTHSTSGNKGEPCEDENAMSREGNEAKQGVPSTQSKDGSKKDNKAADLYVSSPDENTMSMEGDKVQEIASADESENVLKECTIAEEVPVYSPEKTLGEKDFSTFDHHELEAIKEMINLIAKKIRFRESRRKKAEDKGHFFDFRRTIRKNIPHAGRILSLSWKTPKITKTRIVLLCDVSGSMEKYSRFLIQFIYSFQNALDRIETFVFSTRLSRITAILRSRGLYKAMDRISKSVHDWSGGTQIGACLKTFNRRYASNFLYGKTIVMIISDGWDCGDENLIREEMTRLRKKAYHIIWLNPLLSNPHYQPTCMGMRTALPFLDQFLPLYNLNSLITLGQTLVKIN